MESCEFRQMSRNRVRRSGVRPRVGVVSDTHGYFDPRLARVLAGVSVILHAGDGIRRAVRFA